MILADFSHKKELAELWIEAFGDCESFVSAFLEAHMVPGHNAPAAVSEGKIASALYLLDFPLYSKADVLGRCAYLFAAATKREFKNRGLMSELIGYSAELCKDRGQRAIFLFPQGQDKKLFDFYAKFGFEGIYAAKKIRGRGHMPLALAEKDIADAEVFGQIYGAYAKFAAKQPIAPVKDELFYFECAASYLESGHLAALERIDEHNSEKICYVFYKKDKDNYYIDDIIPIGGKKSAEILAEFLSGGGDEINFEINLPPDSPADMQNSQLAMILPLDDGVRGIIRSLEAPLYINMFMNV